MNMPEKVGLKKGDAISAKRKFSYSGPGDLIVGIVESWEDDECVIRTKIDSLLEIRFVLCVREWDFDITPLHQTT